MSARPHAVLADTVFDGEVVHRDCAVVIDGARIAAVLARAARCRRGCRRGD